MQFLEGPAGHAKVPAKVPEDSQVWRCAVYGSRPLIASTPGLSPPERPSLDNSSSQSCSDATCPYSTASSTLSCLLKPKERDKAEKKWYMGKLRHTMVDSWYCLDRVVPEGMNQVSRRLEVGNHKQRTLNARLSSGTSAWTFACPAGLTKIAEAKQEQKSNQTGILYQIKRRVRKSILTFRT